VCRSRSIPEQDIAAPFTGPSVIRGKRPAVAILREQGVNSQVETAAWLERVGFEAHDVHMTDLLSGRRSLSAFKGVRGVWWLFLRRRARRGRGLGQVHLVPSGRARRFRALLRAQRHLLARFLQRLPDVRRAQEPDPGTGLWPRFVTNRSEQYEARFTMVEILDSPSVVLRG